MIEADQNIGIGLSRQLAQDLVENSGTQLGCTTTGFDSFR